MELSRMNDFTLFATLPRYLVFKKAKILWRLDVGHVKFIRRRRAVEVALNNSKVKKVDLLTKEVNNLESLAVRLCLWCGYEETLVHKLIEHNKLSLVFTQCKCNGRDRVKLLVNREQIHLMPHKCDLHNYGNHFAYNNSQVAYRVDKNSIAVYQWSKIAEGQFEGQQTDTTQFGGEEITGLALDKNGLTVLFNDGTLKTSKMTDASKILKEKHAQVNWWQGLTQISNTNYAVSGEIEDSKVYRQEIVVVSSKAGILNYCQYDLPHLDGNHFIASLHFFQRLDLLIGLARCDLMHVMNVKRNKVVKPFTLELNASGELFLDLHEIAKKRKVILIGHEKGLSLVRLF